MQIAQVDVVGCQAPQGGFGGGTQIVRPTEWFPDVRAGADHPDLGGQQEVIRVGVQGLPDEVFDGVGAVGVGGVKVGDAQRRRVSEHHNGVGDVGRHAPGARAGQAHGAQAKTGDLLAGDCDGAAGEGGVHGVSSLSVTVVTAIWIAAA